MVKQLAKKKRSDEVTVLGISPDAPERQGKFDDKHSLGYQLLSDPDHEVALKYGAYGPKKLYGKEYEGIIRSAFLIGPTARIEGAWYKIKPADTPTRLQEMLDELS